MNICFEIPGTPVAKGRPRFVNRGRFVQTYTPDKTASYENLVKLYCPTHYKLSGPLRAEFHFFFPVPKSVSKKKRAEMLNGMERPTKKPDLDNCIKSILDALNGIAFDDDSQVVKVVAEKWYSEEPRAEVFLREYVDSFSEKMNPPEE